MTEIIDLDREFPELSEPAKGRSIPFKMFGREWHLNSGMNTFTFTKMAGGDTASIGEFVTNSVIEAERADWQRALSGAGNLDIPALMALVQRLVEVVGNAPTKSPSASRSSASKKTSARRSTAASSSGRVVRPVN